MEYLMTYGWAILVIAVVLGILFQLGVFGNANLSPKATPGSCEVQRTTASISLEGMCQGELPQDVAVFTASMPGQIVSGSIFHKVGQLTFTAWVDEYNTNSCWQNIIELSNTILSLGIGITCSSQAVIRWSTPLIQPGGGSIPLNSWHFVAGIWNGSNNTLSAYLDGTLVTPITAGSGTTSYTVTTYTLGGHSPYTGMSSFSGEISNVQVYNTSLSSTEIKALYQEGIGGAPVRPQSIMEWWPLNSNLNDYSGSNDNGQAVSAGLGYNNFWTNGYSAP